MPKTYKTDCFAFGEQLGRPTCAALTKLQCENCRYYNPKSETNRATTRLVKMFYGQF